jgi:hypothetical protein
MESSEAAPTALAITNTTATLPWGAAVFTVGATPTAFLISGAMTAVGAGVFSEQQFNAVAGEELILVPGEGLVFNQIDASTASDTRKVLIDVVWEEQ